MELIVFITNIILTAIFLYYAAKILSIDLSFLQSGVTSLSASIVGGIVTGTGVTGVLITIGTAFGLLKYFTHASLGAILGTVVLSVILAIASAQALVTLFNIAFN